LPELRGFRSGICDYVAVLLLKWSSTYRRTSAMTSTASLSCSFGLFGLSRLTRLARLFGLFGLSRLFGWTD